MRHLQPLPKNLALLMVLMAIGYSCLGQNLVPNGSFEEGITCPSFVGNVTAECAFWYSSIFDDEGSTPEWFHECSEFDFFQPPEVAFGNQVPADGEGYVGFVTYRLGSTGIDFREIVGVQLIEELNIGETYLVEFKVSSLEPSGNYLNNNNIGFNFSTHPTYHVLGFPINTSHYKVDTIITLSDEWTQISVEFTADSAYSYFHIGNFYDDVNTQYLIENESSQAGYYVADDVYITQTLATSADFKRTNGLQLFPNPSVNQITVRLNDSEQIKHLHINTITGTHVISYSTVSSNFYAVDTSVLSKGVYILTIETPKTIYYERFIKQ